MLTVPDPTRVDATPRTVIVGLVEAAALEAVEQAATGADALWLRSATPEQVAAAIRATGLPVGVTSDDVTALEELVDAGAVALESATEGALALAAARGLTAWCRPAQGDGALARGVSVAKVVVEGRTGVTVAGDGPAAWGAVVRAVHGGATVLRTTDVRSVRRVVAVTDRLVSARHRRGLPR